MNLSRRSLLSGAAAFIGAAAVGGAIKVSPAFTFVLPKDVAEIKIGEWVMLASHDQQALGYPEDYFGTLRSVSYHEVEYINSVTGMVRSSRTPVKFNHETRVGTLERPIEYRHLNPFPDGEKP